MKTNIITITILTLCLFQTRAQQVFIQVGSFPNYSFSSVHFPTSQIGYAVGGNHNDNKAIVVKTTNGGQNWIVMDIETNRLPYREVYFFDDNDGFTVAENTPNVYVTSDGGNQWQTVNFSSLDWITDIAEANGNLYLTGNNEEDFDSQLYLSTDKGLNWTLIYQDNTSFFREIFFIDSQVGYAVGYEIYKTTDGGTSWQLIPNVGFGDFVTDVIFKDSMVGFTAGTIYESGLSRTMDGGNTWEGLFFVPYSNFVATYNNAVYAGGTYGYPVICSFDLGDTLIELTGLTGINDISLFDEFHGISVGNNGKIYKINTSSLSTKNPKPKIKIKVYPNPAENTLNIEIAGQISVQKICLTDMQGRLVKEYTGDFSKLDVSNIAAGNYFLQIYSGSGKATKKILIK